MAPRRVPREILPVPLTCILRVISRLVIGLSSFPGDPFQICIDFLQNSSNSGPTRCACSVCTRRQKLYFPPG
uniref:Uncharacterized protein n=1 Tax=Anguilla anguilla TaxID=7936 RepID=A0A0E9PWC2_ANGAN